MRLGAPKERHAVLFLALLLLVAGAFTLSSGHSFERPTVPDEKAYYGWARLFNEGYLAVPIEDWYGIDGRAPEAHADIHVNISGVHYLRLAVSTESLNGPTRDDVRALVTWEDGTPTPGATVALWLGPPKPPSQAVTDLNGTATFLDVLPGVWRVAASLFRPPGSGSEPLSLLVADLAAVPPASTPYRTRLAIADIDGAQVTVRVEDVFGTPLPGTSVTLARKTPQGLANVSSLPTDGDGRSAFIVPGTGDYVFAGLKPGLGRGIVAPSVVRVDGRYYVVNRWAPGYQILLGLSLQTGVEDSLTVLLMVAAAASVYLLARRLFEWRVAFLAATLLVTCTLALIMVFLVGMADYASMTFALLGLSLFVEGLDADPKRFREALLLLASGISFGVAVWMRYSTVTLGVAPAAYLVVRALSEWRAASPRSLVPPLKRLVRGGAPFLTGLLILGLPLAAYNVTYFGSPLAAGYNFGTLQVVGQGENATAQLTSGSFYENFNPSAALGSAPLRLAWLVALAPFVLLLPVAVLRHWRRLRTHLLLWTFLANFLLYIFVPWVATWASSPVRSMEDMRYFLPGIPSAAVLAALVLRGEIAVGGWRKWFAIASVVAFVAAGFAGAALGIGLQLARLLPLPGGPVP